jgi:hypothetical protein
MSDATAPGKTTGSPRRFAGIGRRPGTDPRYVATGWVSTGSRRHDCPWRDQGVHVRGAVRRIRRSTGWRRERGDGRGRRRASPFVWFRGRAARANKRRALCSGRPPSGQNLSDWCALGCRRKSARNALATGKKEIRAASSQGPRAVQPGERNGAIGSRHGPHEQRCAVATPLRRPKAPRSGLGPI